MVVSGARREHPDGLGARDHLIKIITGVVPCIIEKKKLKQTKEVTALRNLFFSLKTKKKKK